MKIDNTFKIVAHRLHNQINHKRKYGDIPYTDHLDAVAELVSSSNLNGRDLIVAKSAAFGHDLFEDVFPILYPSMDFSETLKKLIIDEMNVDSISDENISIITDAISVISELTNQYTTEKFPKFNRAKRKQLEAERYEHASNIAKVVKLADIAHNTSDIIENDPEFAEIYLKEKEQMIKFIMKGK